MNPEPIIRLYIPGQTTTKNYQMTSNVRVNGTSMPAHKALEKIQAVAPKLKSNLDPNATGAANSQPVRYTLSSDRIDSITLVDTDDQSVVLGDNSATNVLKMKKEYGDLKYTGSNNFENILYINSATVILAVPDNRASYDEYRRVTPSTFLKVGTTYKVEVYDVTSNTARLVIIYGQAAGLPVTADTTASIVAATRQRISTITNTAIVALDVYEEGVLKTYETENTNSTYTNIKVGDIVRFGFNSSGQINEVKYSQDVNSILPKQEKEIVYDQGHIYYSITGTVYTLSDANIVIAESMVNKNPAEGEEKLDISQLKGFGLNSGVKVYKIDTTKTPAVVEVSNTTNILTEYGEDKKDNASKVFAYAYKTTLKFIVMYITE